MNTICPTCYKASRIITIALQEIVRVRDEAIKVESRFLRCDDCGTEFEDPSSNYDPVAIAYRIYRQRHNLLQPEDIANFRKQYGLTQIELANLLGWGKVTLSRYENGALQEPAQDKLLRLAMEPHTLRKLILENRTAIEESKRARLLKELESLENESRSFIALIEEKFGRHEATIFSGYKNLEIDKAINAIVYFCQKGIVKTKLNKLMFYSDFLNYKLYGTSITGMQYAHATYGPVPHGYEHYLCCLIEDGLLEKNERDFGNGNSGEELLATAMFRDELFKSYELETFRTVAQFFKAYSATEITAFSHKEEAFTNTSNGQLISFDYAESLRL